MREPKTNAELAREILESAQPITDPRAKAYLHIARHHPA